MDSLNVQMAKQKYSEPFTDNALTKSETSNWTTCLKRDTKFGVCLIILLGTIFIHTSNAIPVQASGHRLTLHTQQYRERRYQQLLQEQRSLVVPTPHKHHLHHRSAERMPQTNSRREDTGASGNEFGDYCRAIDAAKDAIRMARDSASINFSQFYDFLRGYTQTRYNESLENFYEQWSKHNLSLNHPHQNLIDRNVNVMPGPENIIPEHLNHENLTKHVIETEFLNINQTLRFLEAVYEERNKLRNEDPSYVHDFHHDNELEDQFMQRWNFVNLTYGNATNFLKQGLHHSNKILEALQIAPKNGYNVWYNREAQQIEWLLFQEHLSVMKYLIDIYTYLLEHCNLTSLFLSS